MPYYIYNIKDPVSQNFSHTIVFSYGLDDHGYVLLKNNLRDFFTFNYRANKICYVTHQDLSDEDRLTIKSLSRIAELGWIKYDSNGISSIENCDVLTANQIASEGLIKIFHESNALLIAESGFHFVLPSKKHSKYFIRVGNMMTIQPHLYFIAFCIILKLNGKNFDKIYYDTPSILGILIAFQHLKAILGYQKLMKLECFFSYDQVKRTSFDTDSLVIISASNSGNLENEIREDLSIVTIVFNGKRDLKYYLLNIHDFDLEIKDWTQYKAHERCDYCETGSVPVYISGDHFLPLKPVINKILLTKDCAPTWLRNFLEQFSYKNTIFCNRREGDKLREIFLDTEHINSKLLDKNVDVFEYSQNIERVIKNDIPISLQYIIYLPDNASKSMADVIYGYYKDFVPNLKAPIQYENIDLKSLGIENTSCTLLIIASTIATGNKLNILSQRARDFNAISLFYLIGISRTENEETERIIIKNLETRDDNLSVSRVKIACPINLPDKHSKYNNPQFKSAWENELLFLAKMAGIQSLRDYESIITRRAKILENETGIQENLFWENPFTNQELKLEKNFAFFKFEVVADSRNTEYVPPPQSEVFFSISSILHNLRSVSHKSRDAKENGKRKTKDTKYIIQHSHIKTILDPKNFTRFNDSIIQASLLRAALPNELNYSYDIGLSHEVKDLLISFFKNKESKTFEPIIEFLYAIATGKLTLLKGDLDEFLQSIEHYKSDYKQVALFLDYINKVILEK